MARPRPNVFSSFGGGYNTRKSVLEMAPNESADLLNVQRLGSGEGAIRRRLRDWEHEDTPPSAPALNSYYRTLMIVPGGLWLDDESHLLHTSDGRLIRPDIMTEVASGIGTGVLSWAVAPASGGQGPLYFLDGTTARYWTGSVLATWTASAGSLPPVSARQLLYVENRMWGIGGTSSTDKTKAKWSELGDPRNWPVANVVDLDPGDGMALTGAGRVGAGLVVFKENKAWLIYDLDTGANRPLSERAGARLDTRNAIVTTPHGLVFIDPDQGICITDGLSVRSIGDDIYPTVRTLIDDDSFSNATATYYNDSYLLLTNPVSALYAGVLLEYDFKTKTWWRHSTEARTLAILTQLGEANRLIAGRKPDPSSRPRLIWVLDETGLPVGTGSNPIAMTDVHWTTPWQVFGDPNQGKRLRHLAVHGDGAASLTVYKDFSTTVLKTATEASFPSGDPSVLEMLTPGKARAFQLKVATTGADMQLHAYEMYAQPRSR